MEVEVAIEVEVEIAVEIEMVTPASPSDQAPRTKDPPGY